MIDTLSKHEAAAQKRAIRWELGLPPGGYLLATLHQPAHVDDPEKLRAILRALAETPLPVVFPLHPRTEKTARDAGLSNLLDKAGATRTLDYLERVMDPRREYRLPDGGRGKRRRQSATPPKRWVASRNP